VVFAAGALVFLVVLLRDRTAGIDVARSVSWSVLWMVVLLRGNFGDAAGAGRGIGEPRIDDARTP
jgi:hypothetical protein